LLTPVFRAGELVYHVPTIHKTRQAARSQLDRFHSSIKRFVNPHRYPVGLEQRLHQMKTELVVQARQAVNRRLHET